MKYQNKCSQQDPWDFCTLWKEEQRFSYKTSRAWHCLTKGCDLCPFCKHSRETTALGSLLLSAALPPRSAKPTWCSAESDHLPAPWEIQIVSHFWVSVTCPWLCIILRSIFFFFKEIYDVPWISPKFKLGMRKLRSIKETEKTMLWETFWWHILLI